MLNPELLQPTLYRKFLNRLEKTSFRKLLILSKKSSIYSQEDKVIEVVDKFPINKKDYNLNYTNQFLLQNRGSFNSKFFFVIRIQELENLFKFKKKLNTMMMLSSL